MPKRRFVSRRKNVIMTTKTTYLKPLKLTVVLAKGSPARKTPTHSARELLDEALHISLSSVLDIVKGMCSKILKVWNAGWKGFYH